MDAEFSLTWATSLWFSRSQVSLMAAFLSNLLAICSSLSCRMSSSLRTRSRSCSAFSRRPQACEAKAQNMVSYGRQLRRQSGSGQLPGHLVDVGDQDSFLGGVDPLIVGPHATLDGEEQNLEVSLLLEPAAKIN